MITAPQVSAHSIDLPPQSTWINQLFSEERQRKEIEFCRLYQREYHHGTAGHSHMMLIGQLADIVDSALTKYISYPEFVMICESRWLKFDQNHSGTLFSKVGAIDEDRRRFVTIVRDTILDLGYVIGPEQTNVSPEIGKE